MALKPSDRWVVALCRDHHAEQHRKGQLSFEARYELDLLALAAEFTRLSPHRALLERLVP
jgi:hypothetical protein